MIDHEVLFNNHRDRSQSIMMYPDVKNTIERGMHTKKVLLEAIIDDL